MTAWAIVIVSLAGLLLGGLFNAVAIHWDKRLPSVYPPSYCAHSRHRPPTYAVIQLLPFLTSGGKCRQCGQRLEWRYAAGEAATALLFGLAAFRMDSQPELIAALWLIAILSIITQTDLTDKIIPNKVVAAGVIGAIVIRLFIHPLPIWNYGIAAVAGSGALLAIALLGSWVLKKETMGGGDIKLYVFIGLMLGVKLTLLSLFLASLFGLIGGLLLIAAGGHARGKTLPFGPYIALGAITAYLWGDGMVEWYLGLLSF
ncbi:prepilin peptidase [Paenibacillus radicis (ex Gao et al. 2016)]|uniref:Type 4 prepilin-like proteins leader peptide-processing enzyme n=1 Tax=Paenibacillus radicis (ex Gao et al. 2016) TaxID=1737354 RepID=A0A917GSB4_9BACL|nr:A24 family peptidase [Paenibacillus radicis (ex Gao et al. 2016)]GGG55498.1 type 4 prepilin-like proteins leader peptide-processing enzyme [Paenibacillus radicis (ex Gao et al. 2016)]